MALYTAFSVNQNLKMVTEAILHCLHLQKHQIVVFGLISVRGCFERLFNPYHVCSTDMTKNPLIPFCGPAPDKKINTILGTK